MSRSCDFLCRAAALPMAVFLMLGNASAQEAASEAAPAIEDARTVEFAVWNAIKASHNPADFVTYLEQYPNGNFAKAARGKLDMLTGNATPTPARPQPVDVSGTADEAGQAAASPSSEVPQDLKAAADMCRDDKVPVETRLASCEAALTATGLDAATRADLNNEVGRAQNELQQYDAAEAAYREAVKYDAANPVYIGNLAAVLLDTSRYDEAITAYTKAIELDPKNSWHYFNRGNAYLYNGDPAKAGADLDAALAIEQSFDLLATRGYVALAEGNDKAAVEFTNRAIAYDGSQNSLQSIAVLYLYGRDKEATDMTDRLIGEDDGYGYGQIWKAMLLTRDGKSGAARSLLGNTLSDHSDDWPGKLIQWMLGKIDDATLIAKAQEGSEEDIRNQLCEAHFYMAARAFDQGDKAGALTHVKAVLETKVYHYIEYFAAAALGRLAGTGE